MSKFSPQEKIDAVKNYLNGSKGQREIAQLIGVDHNILRNWIKQFEYHGEVAFKKPYTFYSVQYKMDVLNYMVEQGTSIRETAAIFNIPSPTTLGKWKATYEAGGKDALELNKKGRKTMKNKKKEIKTVEGSLETLQAENEWLRMENAYLKKLNALVQEKETLQRKTKHK